MILNFIKYAAVGLLNTALHWSVFGGLVYLNCSQSIANVIGFCLAVTFSFFVNAKFTFQVKATLIRYLAYASFMGLLAFLSGWYADMKGINPIITLISFSAFSLIAGFIYSKLVVFRNNEK